MPSLTTEALTEHQIMKYQRRLASFLRDYEYRTRLSAKEVAEQLKVHPGKLSNMKSDAKPFSRFVFSLDFLARIAALQKLTVSEFAAYLDGGNDEEEASGKRKMYSWEKAIVEAFEPVNALLRGKFVELCKDSQREGKEKLEVLIEIVAILQKKDASALALLRDGLRGSV